MFSLGTLEGIRRTFPAHLEGAARGVAEVTFALLRIAAQWARSVASLDKEFRVTSVRL
jgi:hypothetical protein